MTQCNMINVKLSNSQLNQLKWGSDEENNFPQKLLLTNTQVSRFRQDFANSSSPNIKLSKLKSCINKAIRRIFR